MNDQDGYLDLKELSKYTSLSVRTLKDYLRDETDPIPSYRFKRKILVKKSEFDCWLKKHQTKNDRISHIVDEALSDLKAK